MGCSCVYVCCEDNGPAFHETTKPVARKTHKCGECRREIIPGEAYESSRGVWDGDFNTHKTCSECVSVRNEFFCEGWIYGDVLSDLKEHLCDIDGDISMECLDRLTPNGRACVVEMIDEIIDPDKGAPNVNAE